MVLLRKEMSQRIPEMQLSEIEQLLDKNMYGDLSSSRNNPLQRDSMKAEAKDLYEVSIDLAIFVILRLSSTEEETDGIDAGSDFLGHIVTAFVKHLRHHETLSHKAKEESSIKSNKKRGKERSDILTCLPSALTFLKLLQLCDRLQ